MNIYNTKNIEHFDKLHSEWWDKNGSLKTLHDINPTRLKYIKNICPIENKLILDVGCGGGILSASLSKNKAKVIGIDPSKKLIHIASKYAEKNRLDAKFLNVTLEEYVEKVGNKFDIITCMELIEHVEDPSTFIETLKPLLKKNTILFFSTINRNLLSYLKAIFFGEYILHIIPKGTHNFKKFIKPSELNNYLNKIGCDLINFQGFDYNPVTSHVKLSNKIDFNYLSCFRYK